MSTAVLTQESKIPEDSSFSLQSFEHAQRVAKMLSSSNLIPKDYQNNVQNTMIAMEMANRLGASPLMVMQNLNIIHGKPSWSSSFIIAALNNCKKFSPIRFELSGEGMKQSCLAWAKDLSTGDKVIGPTVTMEMAKSEGWIDKAGSKWKTMPELMLRYRSAAFFGRLYAPELLMGMHTAEEVTDFHRSTPQSAKVEHVENFDESTLDTVLKIKQAYASQLITKDRAIYLQEQLKSKEVAA